MRLFACSLGIGLTVSLLAPRPATGQAADSPQPSELGEVIVTGTRAALVESLDRKRDARIVQDSIVAEDLGRFPDDNVADSLSHITGITVTRTRGGEGQYVNVRGLGPGHDTGSPGTAGSPWAAAQLGPLCAPVPHC